MALSFVLVHVALVSPILIPLFSLAGIEPLRAPVVEELFKLAVFLLYRRWSGDARFLVPALLTAGAVALGEAFINVLLRLDGLIAALDLSPSEFDTASVITLVSAIFAAKFLLGTVGHVTTLVSATKLLSRERYLPGYALMVVVHLVLNLAIA